jgi:hypothetical protein
MAGLSPINQQSAGWSAEALALVTQAKVLSGSKIEQLVVRLQRNSGRTKEACWRFVIQYGIKGSVDHRRWTDEEIEYVREEIVKQSVEQIAEKLHRTPKAVRNMLQRNQLHVRELRCDRFSVQSLAQALRVRKSEIHHWIDQGWLKATVERHGRILSYSIEPEALLHMYKHHLRDLLKRCIPNQSLFEAYVQYCFSPKHTVGEQLLDVRRDKRERAAYAAIQANQDFDEEEEDNDESEEDQYRSATRAATRYAEKADADSN